jgi:outer membrane protein
MNRKIKLLLFFTISVLSLRGQGEMSLAECVDYALANHAQIRLAELDIQDASWQIKENTAVAYPNISLGAHYNYFLKQPAIPSEALGFGAPGESVVFSLKKDIGATISATQLIFNNSYLASIKAARMYKDYAALQYEGVAEKLTNQVTDAYIPALVVAEGIKVLEKNIANQRQLVSDTKANYEAGFVEQLDVDRLEFSLSAFETDIESLERQRDKAIEYLKFVMNMPTTDTLILSDDINMLLTQYDDIDPSETVDYMSRPDYLATLKARELSDIQTDAYSKYWWPVVNAFASYNPGYQGNSELYWIPSSIVGVQLTMPIYDGGYARALRERSNIQSLKVDQQKRILSMSYDLELETARNDYFSTKQKLADKERNLALAEKIFNTSETKFKEGVGSSFEVTQAQLGLYQSQADHVNARFDFLKSLVAFKKALGKNTF